MEVQDKISLLHEIKLEIMGLRSKMKECFDRHVSIQDLLSDRWETAEFYGFGKGTSCYNNVLIIGDVKVGENCWIGPNVILDGSGGVEIGDFVSVSAGVQIYSHHNVKWSNSFGKKNIEKRSTIIGNGVYIGPNSVIQMGVDIDDKAIIGAMSFVDKNIKKNEKYYGMKQINA